jgi:spore coat polysaccharide biosynthesis predicted glycosyltransferase SpsG
VKNNSNNLKVLLVCYVGAEIGIGHLSRLLALAEVLKEKNNIISEFLIFGDLVKKKELSNFIVHNVLITDSFTIMIEDILKNKSFDGLIFDLYSKRSFNNLDIFFKKLKDKNISLIGIDSLVDYCDILDILWMPSFNFDHSKHKKCTALIKSGWDSFLIRKRFENKIWEPGSKVLILTGGSDISNLGKTLPIELDRLLSINTQIHWVKGPFSSEPILPNKCKLNWVIHDSPEEIDELIIQSDYIMTVFGVSFFEALQYGIPTVVFSPYGKKDDDEMKALKKEDIAMIADNSKSAVNNLFDLMNNNELARKYSLRALNKMLINGTQNLSMKIYSLIKSK